ncbi:Hypothetical protein PAS_chr2-1_0020 [Komagataella phaffii GS115]|uniref:Uncharacterized protein n=1 Tax=Komagataella phaffii (strain GS115 / ATCC 20864) TaxID=644223 RepID=C4QZE5_KOMPG|nr:Hypothetical protein PAS_chr2-1_0020 [Komagataella phaffii GS115]CAY68619.1 Hypothetical protein PAS_chr2-1_0020 [Komagataella phaffii GS115]
MRAKAGEFWKVKAEACDLSKLIVALQKARSIFASYCWLPNISGIARSRFVVGRSIHWEYQPKYRKVMSMNVEATI